MAINSILVFLIILSFECSGQTKSEVTKINEMVENARRYVNSVEAKDISKRIANEKILSNHFAILIDESKSTLLINSKDEIKKNSDSLINLIDEIILSIEKSHGKDKNEEILNTRESKYVNYVMLDNKKATQLKFAIKKCIESTFKIISENQIKLPTEQLPLSLNLFMESSGKSWEEYIFQNMPYGAVMPIFSKYKKDVVLNKLLVLEELSKKIN